MFAATATCASITPTVGSDYTTLANYIAVGSCTIGDKLFSNFVINFLGGHGDNSAIPSPSVPAAADVQVSALTGSIGLEFDFNAANSVAYGQTLSLDIQYLVTVQDPSWAITSVFSEAYGGLDNVGTALSPIYTDASVTAGKNLCLGAAFDTTGGGNTATNECDTTQLNSTVDNGYGFSLGVHYNDQSGTRTLSSAQTVLGVSDVIALSGGSQNYGSAPVVEIDGMINEFNQTEESGVPEPATLLLIGSALLGLGFLRRKRA
jgi:hypothetical protein